MESLFHVNLSGNQVLQEPIELGTEVMEEENTLTSPSERDSSTGYYKRRDLVCIRLHDSYLCRVIILIFEFF